VCQRMTSSPRLFAAGFRFRSPQLDDKRPPIFTPPEHRSPRAAGGGGGRPSRSGRARGEQMQGELGVIQNAAQMALEFLASDTAPAELRRNDVLVELVAVLEARRAPLQAAVQTAMMSGDASLEALLQLNDSVNSIHEAWRDLRKHNRNPLSTSAASAAPAPLSTPAPRAAPKSPGTDLLGLGTGIPLPASIATAPSTSASVSSTSSTASPASKPPPASRLRRQRAADAPERSGGASRGLPVLMPLAAPPSSGAAVALKPLAPPPTAGRRRGRSRGGSAVASEGVASAAGDTEEDLFGGGVAASGEGGTARAAEIAAAFRAQKSLILERALRAIRQEASL
jgi:hypothetical protein